jgi:hypothetical protein
MISKTALTAKRIYELFHVDLVGGALYHKRSVGLARKGQRAGYIAQNGYRYISIDRRDYLEHQIIWFLTKGEWLPNKTHEIDHENRLRYDNAPSNLRKATRGQNNYNAGMRSDNITGVRGVYFCKVKKKYIVQVTANKKTHTLGRFASLVEATQVAVAGRERLHGSFAYEARNK